MFDLALHGGIFADGGDLVNGIDDFVVFGEKILKGELVEAYISGQSLSTIINASDSYSFFEFSPQGNRFFTVKGSSYDVNIYDVVGDNFVHLGVVDVKPPGNAVDISSNFDGSVFATAQEFYGIFVYREFSDGYKKVPLDITPSGYGYATAFNDDGDLLFIGHQYSPFISIYKWNGSTYVKVANSPNLPSNVVKSLVYRDHILYCNVGDALGIQVYEVSPEGLLTKIPHTVTKPNSNFIYGRKLRLSPDGKRLATMAQDGSQHTLVIYDVDNGKIMKAITYGSASSFYGVNFLNNSTLIFSQGSALAFLSMRNIQWSSFGPRHSISASSNVIAINKEKGLIAADSNSGNRFNVFDGKKHSIKSSGKLRNFTGTNPIVSEIGYAKQSGVAGQVKKIKSLWGV